MVKKHINGEVQETILKVRIRLDFKSEVKSKLFANKNLIKAAEEAREQHVALLRNVPFQGVKIDDLDLGMEIYVVFDETLGEDVAYAPVFLNLEADSFEDIVRFVMRDEFRKIEIIEPQEIFMSKQDAERLLFKANAELKSYRNALDKKYNLR
ncbi:MAG: hypothetical protein APF76_07535 [Desulfitibacter sp. BRH_c19]|nr:MAG: hypothetical protein APF76_07535 [Desulfitibacter sp. BRH_c19]